MAKLKEPTPFAEGSVAGWRVPLVPSAEEYRRLVAQCLALAERATDQSDKARLLEIAQAWLDLARKKTQTAEPKGD